MKHQMMLEQSVSGFCGRSGRHITKDQMLIDVRDKYIAFGKSNAELLALEADNELLPAGSYKKPWYRSQFSILLVVLRFQK